MNLLDTASLVVTPNGYKASKLYSIIPSDGTGDMTFARTGDTATRVNSSGLIETVLANKPRLDYLESTCPNLLLEPQRTNIYPNSNNFASGYVLDISTITANTVISPDGTQNADTWLESSGNEYHRFYYNGFSTTSGQAYTASLFVKANGRNWISISFSNAFNVVKVWFNISNGTIGTTQSGITAKIDNYGNGWYRISATLTAIATGTGFVEYNIATADLAYIYEGDNTKGLYIYGAQLEAGSYATSYIPTTTASVTRNADDCTKSSAGALMNTEMTIFYHGISPKTSTTNRELWIKGGGTFYDNLFGLEYLSYSGIDTFKVFLNSSGSQFEFLKPIPVNTEFKMAVRMKQNDIALYFNGTLVGTDTSATIPSFTTIYLGRYLDLAIEDNQVKAVALWKTGLTNQELVTLTSL